MKLLKILNKLLTWLVGIAVFVNIATLILGIFYFFDLMIFKIWLSELVVIFGLALAKIHVVYTIYDKGVGGRNKWKM